MPPLFRRDPALRAAGVALLLIAVPCLRLLFEGAGPHRSVTAAAIVEATLAFLCTSAGAGLVVLGAHIHDRIRVSQRWAGTKTDPVPRAYD